jgi:predicted ribosome-associated RNA-binding protein Tma20
LSKQYEQAAALPVGGKSPLWEESGIQPAKLPKPFLKLCEDLYATRNVQSLAQFMGVCMDAWQAMGGKRYPRVFAQAKARIMAGEDEGTIFVPQPTRLQGRKRWIAFFHHPRGSLFVDAGARKALRESGKSLLPPGVSRCEGDFAAGDVVRMCDLNGTEFARGIAGFDSAEIRGRKLQRVEVVHRDNLVVL